MKTTKNDEASLCLENTRLLIISTGRFIRPSILPINQSLFFSIFIDKNLNIAILRRISHRCHFSVFSSETKLKK